jgi:hypothetical protein
VEQRPGAGVVTSVDASVRELDHYRQLAEASIRSQRERAELEEAQRAAERAAEFKRLLTRVRHTYPESLTAGWTPTDPGEYRGNHSYRRDWPDVVFERTFEAESLTVRVGISGDSYQGSITGAHLHTRKPGVGWQEFYFGGFQGVDANASEAVRESFFALAVMDAVEVARIEQATEERRAQPPSETPRTALCVHSDWRARLARECPDCGAVEIERFDVVGES